MAFLAASCLCVPGSSQSQPTTNANATAAAPLPSAAELKQRVLENLKKSQAELERYLCQMTRETDITDKNGKLKRRELRQYDMFFVNGQEIDQLTAKGGKNLDAGGKKKETDRVRDKIKKDSDMEYVAKKDAENAKQIDMLLHMLRYTNGHRVEQNGRSLLVYDLTGDPNVHPHGTEETFLHSMRGTIQVDEQTGELVDLTARLDHDVKVGAGFLADIHKGLWIHVRQQRYPDGVWLPQLVEGNGDARAALFFHPYFRFSERLNSCKLTNVTTSESVR